MPSLKENCLVCKFHISFNLRYAIRDLLLIVPRLLIIARAYILDYFSGSEILRNGITATTSVRRTASVQCSVQHNFLCEYGRELPNAKTGSLLIYSTFRNRKRVGKNHQEDNVCQKWVLSA
jgi:hypothetical protein